ncbi:redoxin domain-containing protein [Variovorax sp. M-6]|uniref:redoxin domain-containing protein n=1 Tax=Variovorax sp. M-6 TaxID=3233041 RepID=UPI003F9BF9F5
MKRNHFTLLVVAVVCSICGGTDLFAADRAERPPLMSPLKFPPGKTLVPALGGAVDWLNSKPLTADDLQGKVVLVNFWTYSCINSHRTLPHIQAWADKYKDQGLVVINVHTPEFGFEKDIENVRKGIADLQVQPPVAVDSKRAIWNAFDNDQWPALYFIDARGRIRHHQFGEGQYERSERVLQSLLTEAGAKGVDSQLVRVAGSGSQAQADWDDLQSPETYVGYDRAEGFVSPGGVKRGVAHLYVAPDQLKLNSWALSGHWRVGGEAAALERANGRILYRFHSRDLHLVMGSAVQGKTVPFRVLVDGKPPGMAHGADIDAEGRGVLSDHRLYQLIRQAKPIADRLFEIEFFEPGIDAYSFTFG